MDRPDRRGRVMVCLASHAVAGRAAHTNWYYYCLEQHYTIYSRRTHLTSPLHLSPLWSMNAIFIKKYCNMGRPHYWGIHYWRIHYWWCAVLLFDLGFRRSGFCCIQRLPMGARMKSLLLRCRLRSAKTLRPWRWFAYRVCLSAPRQPGPRQ